MIREMLTAPSRWRGLERRAGLCWSRRGHAARPRELARRPRSVRVRMSWATYAGGLSVRRSRRSRRRPRCPPARRASWYPPPNHGRLDQARRLEREEDLDEIVIGNAPGFGDVSHPFRRTVLAELRQLDHGEAGVLGLRGHSHHVAALLFALWGDESSLSLPLGKSVREVRPRTDAPGRQFGHTVDARSYRDGLADLSAASYAKL